MAASLPGVKIALTCSGLSHVRRGVETWSQEAFIGLREQGIDVTLFQGSGPNGLPGVHVLPCIRRGSRWSERLGRLVPPFGWRLGIGSSYQMEQTTFALSLLREAGRRFDLLHTKDPQVALLMQRAHRAGLSRAKVIFNHGTEEPPEFLSRFEYVQHLAPFHLDEAKRQGLGIRRQFAIPNFVDVEKFHPGSEEPMRRRLGIPRGAFVVLCVAAIKRHHKRVDWLIEEMARAASGWPELHLVVVGARTGDTPALQQLGQERLGRRAVFLTDLPREEMPQAYRAADAFVLCSLKEMLANACLEALASGLPCLMHREPVAGWALGDGGWTIDMTQRGGLASALVALREAQRRQEIGRRARQQALRRFAKEVVLTQQLAMYREVLAA